MWNGVLRIVALRLVLPTLALVALASPGGAVTCEETRALTDTELRYWAARLEVSPNHLAVLLEKAFCEAAGTGDRARLQDRKRRAPNSHNPSTLD